MSRCNGKELGKMIENCVPVEKTAVYKETLSSVFARIKYLPRIGVRLMPYLMRECIFTLPAIALLLALSADICFGLDDKTADYMTVEGLFLSCKMPAPCGTKVDCEGKTVRIAGYIDWSNVYDKKNYPGLPYQKFTIYDEDDRKSVEVWVVSEEDSGIFDKIYQYRAQPRSRVFIEGVVIGFDLPIMGTCRRMIKIELRRGCDLFFQ